MLRKVINIDEEKCNGCGDCIPECHEGALQIIDEKCRLISELFCDGLGACVGHCPEGAITIEEREAEPYDEIKVIDNLLEKPFSVMKAHLFHLKEHGANDLLNQALDYLERKDISLDKLNGLLSSQMNPKLHNIEIHSSNNQGCPGSQMRINEQAITKEKSNSDINESQLRQWPIQLHLVNPEAPYFKNSEIVIMSTCGPVASANVHEDYLKNRTVVIACPKLDYTDPYTDKLSLIFKSAGTKKSIVVIMEVPCCKGLSQFAFNAAKGSGNKGLIVEEHILTLDGKLKAKNILFKN